MKYAKYSEWANNFVPRYLLKKHEFDEDNYECHWRASLLRALEKTFPNIQELRICGVFENLIHQLQTNIESEYAYHSLRYELTEENIEKLSHFKILIKEVAELLSENKENFMQIGYEGIKFQKNMNRPLLALALVFPSERMRNRCRKILTEEAEKKISFSSQRKEVDCYIFTVDQRNTVLFISAAYNFYSKRHTISLESNRDSSLIIPILKEFYSLFKFINNPEKSPYLTLEERQQNHEIGQRNYDIRLTYGWEGDEIEEKRKVTVRIPEEIKKILNWDNDPIYCAAVIEFFLNTNKGGPFVSGIVDIIQEYYRGQALPRIELYKSNRNRMGLTFSSEFGRNFFMTLFKDLGEKFSTEEERLARYKGYNFTDNSKWMCLMPNKKIKKTLYIPAVMDKYICIFFKNNRYLKRFCELVNLEDNLKPEAFSIDNTFIILKDKNLFNRKNHIPLTGRYEQLEQSASLGMM